MIQGVSGLYLNALAVVVLEFLTRIIARPGVNLKKNASETNWVSDYCLYNFMDWITYDHNYTYRYYLSLLFFLLFV